MKTCPVSTPFFLRVSAVVFAAAMLAVFVWYSQSRAEAPPESQVREVVQINESGWTDFQTFGRTLMLTSKSGIIPISPPMVKVMPLPKKEGLELDQENGSLVIPVRVPQSAIYTLGKLEWEKKIRLSAEVISRVLGEPSEVLNFPYVVRVPVLPPPTPDWGPVPSWLMKEKSQPPSMFSIGGTLAQPASPDAQSAWNVIYIRNALRRLFEEQHGTAAKP